MPWYSVHGTTENGSLFTLSVQDTDNKSAYYQFRMKYPHWTIDDIWEISGAKMTAETITTPLPKTVTPTRQVFFLYVLGAGRYTFDPGGALQICRAVHALGPAITVPPPFYEEDIQSVPDYIKTKIPANALIIYSSDSCGSNKFGWVLDAIYPRSIEAAELIQASVYCGNFPFGDNVKNVTLYYNDWLSWPFPGLGSFKILPKIWSPTVQSAVVYPGKYSVNRGRTLVDFCYAPGPHPGDDNTGIQGFILRRAKTVIAAAAAA